MTTVHPQICKWCNFFDIHSIQIHWNFKLSSGKDIGFMHLVMLLLLLTTREVINCCNQDRLESMKNKLKMGKGVNKEAAQNHGIQKPYGINYKNKLLKHGEWVLETPKLFLKEVAQRSC